MEGNTSELRCLDTFDESGEWQQGGRAAGSGSGLRRLRLALLRKKWLIELLRGPPHDMIRTYILTIGNDPGKEALLLVSRNVLRITPTGAKVDIGAKVRQVCGRIHLPVRFS